MNSIKNEVFKKEIARIEKTYRERLPFPISHYFEWRIHPYNLVLDSSKTLDNEVKEAVIKSFNLIYSD